MKRLLLALLLLPLVALAITISDQTHRNPDGTQDSAYPADSKPSGPPNNAPIWNSTPAPIATEGIASSYSLANAANTADATEDVSDDDADALTLANETGCTLPTGVTINNTTYAIDFSTGTGAGTTTGCVFSADDGTAAAVNSSAVSIVVNAAAAPSSYPIYEFCVAYMSEWGGTCVSDSNTRYWETTPTYPTCDSTYSSVASLNTAIGNANADDVLCLQDGNYNATDITINTDGVIVAAENKNGARLTGGVQITVGGDDVDVIGFEWSNTTGATDLVRFNGDDDRALYLNIENVSSGGRWINLNGHRGRLAYSTIDYKGTDGSMVHSVNTANPSIYSRVDHNHLINFSGPTNGGSSEVIQVGQSSPYTDYFWLIDSNYIGYANNDGNGNSVNSGEDEWFTGKARSILVLHNYMACNNGRGGSRAGTQEAFINNWVNACTVSGNTENPKGFHMHGQDDLVVGNYFFDGNSKNNNYSAAIEARAGDSRTYTNGVYLPADNIEIAFNTSTGWSRPLVFGNQQGNLYPNNGKLCNNAFGNTGGGNTVGVDNHGTGWSSAGNVLQSPDNTSLTVTTANPGYELDGDQGKYYVPTTSGNLDGNASAACWTTALYPYDIMGTAVPTTGGDIGAIQGQPDMSVDPIQQLIDESGVNAQ